MEEKNYPGVSLRVKAVVTDSIVLLILIIAATYLLESFENTPDYARAIAFLFIFLLYDPLLTSTIGGTIGHQFFGIRVKRAKNEKQNILFPLALIRFIAKASLGIISFITVMSNKKGKAIHDMLIGSVVVYKNE